MHKLVLTLAAAASLFAVAAPAVAGGSPTVKVTNYKFTAKVLHVSRGTTVTWKWAGTDPHNVTGHGFKSKTQVKGTFKHRFTKPGTYKYVCTIHTRLGMHGTIVVS
ncbi:MAG: copper-binding protein [Solirubrobacteraceae bacterium]|nr:copper-binding protein [Solirubrobacteraceae bacterium]